MLNKLAFELSAGETPNHFLIRLTDERQINALTLGEGFARPIKLDPIPVVYDEGNGELFPVGGFDDKTSRGRIAIKIMADVYCDAIEQIIASKMSEGRSKGDVQSHSYQLIQR